MKGLLEKAEFYHLLRVEELEQAIKKSDEERIEKLKGLLSSFYKCPECNSYVEPINLKLEADFISTEPKSVVCKACGCILELAVFPKDLAKPLSFHEGSLEELIEKMKIHVGSAQILSFEQQPYVNLSVEQLKRIVAFHKDRKNSLSESKVRKALDELESRSLEVSKPQIEPLHKQKRSLFSKLKQALIKVRGVFS